MSADKTMVRVCFCGRMNYDIDSTEMCSGCAKVPIERMELVPEESVMPTADFPVSTMSRQDLSDAVGASCDTAYGRNTEPENSVPGFKQTPEHINALPEPVRKYIMELETLVDPAGIVAQNVLTLDQNNMLSAKAACLETEVEQLRKALSDCAAFYFDGTFEDEEERVADTLNHISEGMEDLVTKESAIEAAACLAREVSRLTHEVAEQKDRAQIGIEFLCGILYNLPSNKDWLDPDLEKAGLAFLKSEGR